MDLGTSIIGAILVAICVLPFLLLGRSRRKREKRMMQSLMKIAEKENCIISEQDSCREFIIGIDRTNHFLFFNKFSNGKETSRFANLEEIQSCKLVNKSRAIDKKESNVLVIDKLELSFRPLDKNSEEFSWEFYSSDENSHLDDELQLLEKWVKIINNHIQRKRNAITKPKPGKK